MPDLPRFLTAERVLSIHEDGIACYGGSPGVRDMGLLQSAVNMPQAGFGGDYFHKDLFEMGAAYLFHIVKNHPFVDGNKRAGLMAALFFMEMNGIEIRASNTKKSDMALEVAEGRLGKPDIADFFRKHTRRA